MGNFGTHGVGRLGLICFKFGPVWDSELDINYNRVYFRTSHFPGHKINFNSQVKIKLQIF